MKKYTWKPDLPDIRDFKYTPTISMLPPKVNLSSQYNHIYDQGQLGSCTSNCISLGFDFTRIKENLSPLLPSRLFIYYNERKMEGTIKEDSGAMIRDGIKSVSKEGVCRESIWPYNINKFKNKPTKYCYKDGTKNIVKTYMRLDNTILDNLKSCLAEGYGFVFGFSVYESFESAQVAKTGQVELPKKGESLLGGHAVFCLGYDDSIKKFIVRNSWGSSWGDGGHFYIPYSYLTNTNLADDFWTIRVI